MGHQNHLGEESIGKLLLKYSIPAIIGMLVNALYNIVDRMFIGRIPEVGSLALTGVGITMPIISILLAFALMLLSIISAIADSNEYPNDLIDSIKLGANGILSLQYILTHPLLLNILWYNKYPIILITFYFIISHLSFFYITLFFSYLFDFLINTSYI